MQDTKSDKPKMYIYRTPSIVRVLSVYTWKNSLAIEVWSKPHFLNSMKTASKIQTNTKIKKKLNKCTVSNVTAKMADSGAFTTPHLIAFHAGTIVEL